MTEKRPNPQQIKNSLEERCNWSKRVQVRIWKNQTREYTICKRAEFNPNHPTRVENYCAWMQFVYVPDASTNTTHPVCSRYDGE